jgi:predicted DNA-binding protein
VEKKKKVLAVRVSDSMMAGIRDAAKKEDKAESDIVREAIAKKLKK